MVFRGRVKCDVNVSPFLDYDILKDTFENSFTYFTKEVNFNKNIFNF